MPSFMRRRRASILGADDPAHLGQKLVGARLGSALLKDDLPLVVEKRNDRGVVEAAVAVGPVTDAERRRQFAHRVFVAVIERPTAELEPMFVGIDLQPRWRIDGRIERKERELNLPGRGGRCFSIHIMSATIAGHMSGQDV